MHDSNRDELDPRRYVHAPVADALNHIALAAVVGFAIVAGFATVPLIAHMNPRVHEAFHILFLLGGVVFAVAIGGVLILRPPPAEGDVWARASEIDPSLARFARWVSTFMAAGWLASMAVVIAHHHLDTPQHALLALAVLAPLAFAAWLLAVYAWSAWCRATLAHAEHEADRRLRQYWSTLSSPHRAPRAR